MSDTHCYEVSIRVLFYKEDEEWVAHALEMDLLGYGKTTKVAFNDLLKSIRAQISFASCKGNPESIFFPAPQDIVKRWETAQVSSLKNAVLGNQETASKMKFKAAVVSIGDLIRPSQPKGHSSRDCRGHWEPSLAAA